MHGMVLPTRKDDLADMPHDTDPSRLYSIGSAVAELQRSFPDVTHSSLRFLEREGLLEPVRTDGGHRKFRASDLERIRTIKEWQAQHLSLEEIRHRLEIMGQMMAPGEVWPRYLELALEGRIHEAASLILNMDDAGYPLVTMFQEVLSPALIELGDRWAAGTATVGQEHEVSELTRDLISDLTGRHAGRIRDDFSVLAACVEGELHELGLRMVFGLLRQRGVLVHFLGANVPTAFLVESVLMRQPEVVLLSASLEPSRPGLTRAVEALLRNVPLAVRPEIAVGGKLGALDEALGADVTAIKASSLEESVEKIMSLSRRS